MLIPLASMMVSMLEPAMTPGAAGHARRQHDHHHSRLNLPHQCRAIRAGVRFVMRLRGIAAQHAARIYQRTARKPGMGTRIAQRLPRQQIRRTANTRRWMKRCIIRGHVAAFFYIQPSLMRFGLVPLMLISQIGLLAGPAILLAWFGRYRWVETFSWRRPAIAAAVGGLLLGIGLSPWMQLATSLQSKYCRPIKDSRNNCSSSSPRRWSNIRFSFPCSSASSRAVRRDALPRSILSLLPPENGSPSGRRLFSPAFSSPPRISICPACLYAHSSASSSAGSSSKAARSCPPCSPTPLLTSHNSCPSPTKCIASASQELMESTGGEG